MGDRLRESHRAFGRKWRPFGADRRGVIVANEQLPLGNGRLGAAKLGAQWKVASGKATAWPSEWFLFWFVLFSVGHTNDGVCLAAAFSGGV